MNINIDAIRAGYARHAEGMPPPPPVRAHKAPSPLVRGCTKAIRQAEIDVANARSAADIAAAEAEAKAQALDAIVDQAIEQHGRQRCLSSCGRIQRIVAAYFNISVDNILSTRRSAELMVPRQIAIYLSSQTTRLSLVQIGRQFERDHTTVIHAIHRVKDRISVDEEFCARVAELRTMVERGLS